MHKTHHNSVGVQAYSGQIYNIPTKIILFFLFIIMIPQNAEATTWNDVIDWMGDNPPAQDCHHVVKTIR